MTAEAVRSGFGGAEGPLPIIPRTNTAEDVPILGTGESEWIGRLAHAAKAVVHLVMHPPMPRLPWEFRREYVASRDDPYHAKEYQSRLVLRRRRKEPEIT